MRVYLSSTLNDLGPERQAVKEALGGECTVVESYSADERSVRDSCLADVAGCDRFIGIVGRRYGFIPPGQPFSITELEYQKAREHKLPTLIFVKDDSAITLPFSDAGTRERDPELIESFRQKINSGADDASRGVPFKTPADLKFQVLKAYHNLSLRHDKPLSKCIEGRPYPGLRAFRTTESDRFFGRDAEIEALTERLIVRSERFLAVIGPSGSGKSSLVYAGLIPALKENAITGNVRWVPVSFSPGKLGNDPFLPLADALSELFPDQNWCAPDLTQRLQMNPVDIATVARDALGLDGAAAQLLLFVDQFEEVFASKVEEAARSNFFKLLTAAVECPLVRVVVAMRSDFYDQWPQEETCIALLRSGHFPVAVPGQAALERMITGPAQAAGLTISPHLVQRILDDTGSGPGALALAEFALSLLYDKRDGDTLTEAAYEAIGGVAGAIDGLAEQAVAKAVVKAKEKLNQDPEVFDEKSISPLFLAIASVEQRDNAAGGALAVVRRRAAKGDLPEAALILAKELVDKRILVSSNEQPAVYEVGHEAVFSHWKRFKDWYARYAADLALRHQAEQAARDWDRSNDQQRSVLKWGWERQKPAIEALRKLNQLALPAHDKYFSDSGIATWRVLEPQLPELLRHFLTPEPLALLDELNTDHTPHHRREEIGLRLNQLGDPRRGVGLREDGLPDIVWVDMPPGEVILEGTKSDKLFPVPRFRLARYPVTWAQYRAFLDAADGYCNPAWWEGQPREEKPGQQLWSFDNYPAINVSWYDAVAYCRWLRVKLQLPIRLPTEWEWQWAALGNTQQNYPWGEWNGQRANSDESGIGRTVAVGLYPLGRRPPREDVLVDDMAGNVWEWCLYEHAVQENCQLSGSEACVLRGGCWLDSPDGVRASVRDGTHPGNRNFNIGFRVLCSSPIELRIAETLVCCSLIAPRSGA
ncbi:Sulphatase-modifying factor protein [Nitrosomonas sp. Is79A3]|uniref:nSTAND1 domain-containing NTPase n=1 Tax=Nitrosomonas sp. (strain Is79A3) TaxID=261292 RepID=UPI000215D12D